VQTVPSPTEGIVTAVAARYGSTLLRYGCAGAVGTALHYALLLALLDVVTPVKASTIGACAGLVASYWLARRWVFADRRAIRLSFTKLLLVALGSVGVNAAILSLMILSMPILPSQLIATGCAFLAGFVINDIWRFSEHR